MVSWVGVADISGSAKVAHVGMVKGRKVCLTSHANGTKEYALVGVKPMGCRFLSAVRTLGEAHS